MRVGKVRGGLLIATVACGGTRAHADEGPPADLGALDLRELATVSVVSVSRRREEAGQTPAAVSVLTAEDLRRAGVLTLPDALRLVPGVQVARLSSHDWAVSVRGWNGQFSEKLLVLVDGRSVYTPLFSGVFWSVHDLVLEDVDRIEVVRGAGGTLWGANAVNGVINIVTRSAARSQGLRTFAAAGTEPRVRTGVSYGTRLGGAAHVRLFGRFVEHGQAALPDGTGADDAWRAARAGVRADWALSPDDDLSAWVEGQLTGIRQRIEGLTTPEPPFRADLRERRPGRDAHLVVRYQHRGPALGEVTVQSSLARLDHPVLQIRDRRTTFELDAQHSLLVATPLRLTWGVGYARTSDDIPAEFSTTFSPAQRTLDLPSAFAELQLNLLGERLRLIPGARVEHNDFTGWEALPSARLWASLGERLALWASVARAVRTPSRLDRDIVQNSAVIPPAMPGDLPILRQTRGSATVQAESLIAYEVGWRGMPNDQVSWDLALFVNQYRDLIMFAPLPPEPSITFLVQPAAARNGPDATSYGGELSLTTQPLRWQRLRASWSLLRFSTAMPMGAMVTRDQPQHQGVLTSSTDLGRAWQLDLVVRFVDQLRRIDVSRYVTADMRVGYELAGRWDVSLVARDLFGRHAEFRSRSQNPPTDVARSVYARVAARF